MTGPQVYPNATLPDGFPEPTGTIQWPAVRLTDPGFVWVPSGQTDVTRIWRKYGWTPPSERKAK